MKLWNTTLRNSSPEVRTLHVQLGAAGARTLVVAQKE